MSTEEKLDNALERLKSHYAEVLTNEALKQGEVSYCSEEDYNYFGSEPTTAVVTRLRLDWELARDFKTFTGEDIAHLMIIQAKSDVLDLLVNGDVTNTADALYKAMDGSKKRGTEPTLVDVIASHLRWEYKWRKDTTEFTLYLNLATRWD